MNMRERNLWVWRRVRIDCDRKDGEMRGSSDKYEVCTYY